MLSENDKLDVFGQIYVNVAYGFAERTKEKEMNCIDRPMSDTSYNDFFDWLILSRRSNRICTSWLVYLQDLYYAVQYTPMISTELEEKAFDEPSYEDRLAIILLASVRENCYCNNIYFKFVWFCIEFVGTNINPVFHQIHSLSSDPLYVVGWITETHRYRVTLLFSKLQIISIFGSFEKVILPKDRNLTLIRHFFKKVCNLMWLFWMFR